MRDPKNLTFWSDLVDFLVRVYRFASKLPRDEQYTLGTELKRYCIRVRSYVVDGAASEAAGDCAKSMEVAYRALRDIVTCIEFAVDLELCKRELVTDLIATGDRMAGAVYSYRRSLF